MAAQRPMGFSFLAALAVVASCPVALAQQDLPAERSDVPVAPAAPAPAGSSTPAPADQAPVAASEAPTADGSPLVPTDQATSATAPAPEPPTPAREEATGWHLQLPTLSGCIQMYYKRRFERSGDSSTEFDFFRIQRLKIRIEGSLLPRLTYQVEVDPRSPEITGVLRDAYVEYEFLAHQFLRVGQQKVIFGYENPESSSNLYTVNRTEVGELHGRGFTLRDIGVGWLGHVTIRKGLRIEHAVSITNGAGMNVQADNDGRKNFFGRIGARYRTRLGTARLGVSGAYGSTIEPGDPGPPAEPDVVDHFKRIGADLEVDTRYSFLAAEWARGWEDVTGSDEGGTLDAWYVLGVVKTPWDLGPVLRYDQFGPVGEPVYHRWTLGLFYGLPGETVRFLLTYELPYDDGRKDDRLTVWGQVEF